MSATDGRAREIDGEDRQDLYRRLAEQIWDPNRLEREAEA